MEKLSKMNMNIDAAQLPTIEKGTLNDETTSDYLNKDFHGTGCAISTAILCNLVNKKKLKDACSNSHKFLSKLIQDSFKTSGQDILNFKK